MQLIGIVTAGGDAPGMNAAIRAIVRTASAHDLNVVGFERGYAGLLADEHRALGAREVGGISHMGGTILRTSRTEEVRREQGIARAAEVLMKRKTEGLVVIGGDGSFKAACELHKASGVPIIGIPATIDNDLAGTDATIGFDTAVNTALSAIDKIRDTATSHERIFIVEVMGRNTGFIALEVGVAAGAEVILIPEIKWDVETVCRRLAEGHRRGKKSAIIVMAEGAGDCTRVTEAIGANTGFDVRLTRLGHVQRGGHPTAYSRLLACKMGAASVEFLLEGRKRDMTGVQEGHIVPVDLEYATKTPKTIDSELYKLALTLAR